MTEMTGEEFGLALIDVLTRKKARSGETVITLSGLETLVRSVLDPKAEMTFSGPTVFRQLPVAPEYPKLKVRYQPGKPWIELERKIVNNVDEEVPYMSGGWHTVSINTPPLPGTEAAKNA